MCEVQAFTKDDIDQAYLALGHRWGWSFMGTPADRLQTAKVAIVGLNPGGGGDGDDYAYGRFWDFDGVNAYFDEKWGPNGESDSPLQRQVKEWHRLLGIGPDAPLCIQFCPFRSPNWSTLAKPEESLEFSEKLWRWVLDTSPASLFITMGKLPAQYLADLMAAKWIAQLPTGWGTQMIDVYDSSNGKRIIAMPHPSRYQIFGRGEDLSGDVERAFQAAADVADQLEDFRK